jgi:hypothetical protein
MNFFSQTVSSFFNMQQYLYILNLFMNFTDFFFIFMFFFFLKLLFFSYFFSTSADSRSIDTEYTVTSLVTESEKEIASIDDLIPLFLTLIFLFGVYFSTYGLIQTLNLINSYVVLYVLIPLFLIYIYVVPLCLLFDFGIYCFIYLRGSGPTSALCVELMYDVINLFAFYIRVGIQLARILLMTIAGGSLQEFIYYFTIDSRLFCINDSVLNELYNLEFNLSSISFFFLYKLPLFFIY